MLLKSKGESICRFFPETQFGGFTDIDGTIAFYSRVHALLNTESVVLDVGCGRGRYTEDEVKYRRNIRDIRSDCERVIGIDVTEEACENPAIDEFRLIHEDTWPIDDESVDVCVSDYVLEHVADPNAFFSECRRVLRPGGFICLRTANLVSYVGLLSYLIPDAYHGSIIQRVQSYPRMDEDVFRTHYKCNTVWKLRSMMDKWGFVGVAYGYGPEPGYLSFSSIAYALGVLYRKLMPGPVQTALFGFGKKKEKVRTRSGHSGK